MCPLGFYSGPSTFGNTRCVVCPNGTTSSAYLGATKCVIAAPTFTPTPVPTKPSLPPTPLPPSFSPTIAPDDFHVGEVRAAGVLVEVSMTVAHIEKICAARYAY
jgi:hypothetical protein